MDLGLKGKMLLSLAQARGSDMQLLNLWQKKDAMWPFLLGIKTA